MHTNYRRIVKFRGKHHNRRGFCVMYSRRIWRQAKWREIRANTRELMFNERYDDLPNRYPKTVLWDYW